MQTAVQKLSVTEKIGYSLGDLAANLIFQTLMTFLAFSTQMCTKFQQQPLPLLFLSVA